MTIPLSLGDPNALGVVARVNSRDCRVDIEPRESVERRGTLASSSTSSTVMTGDCPVGSGTEVVVLEVLS